MPGGGIMPARSFRMTRSQISGWSPTAFMSTDCSDKLPAFPLSL